MKFEQKRITKPLVSCFHVTEIRITSGYCVPETANFERGSEVSFNWNPFVSLIFVECHTSLQPATLTFSQICLAVSMFSILRKSQSSNLFIFKFKWRLNNLEPVHLELAFKTLWNLSSAIEEVKMSEACKGLQTLASCSRCLTFTSHHPWKDTAGS